MKQATTFPGVGGLGFVLFFLGIYLLPFLSWLPGLGRTVEYAVVSTLFIVSLLMGYWHGQRIPLDDKRLWILAAIYIVLMLNSLHVADAKALVRGAFLGLSFLVCLMWLQERQRAERVLTWFLGASLLSLAAIFVVVYATGSGILWTGYRLSLGWNSNVLGMVSVAIFTSVFVLNKQYNHVKYALFAPMLLIIFFSGSRGSFLAAMVSLLAYFVIDGLKNRIARKSHALVLQILLALIVMLMLANWQFVQERLEATSAIHQRLHAWMDALTVWQHQPMLGGGIGMQEDYLQDPARFGIDLPYPYAYGMHPFSHMHNDFLGAMAETGLLGLFTMLALIAYAFYRLFQLWRQGDNAASALFIGLLGYCVNAMSETMFMQGGGSILWFMAVMAISYALASDWNSRLDSKKAAPDSA